MIKANISTYHRFAFALGALGLIAVACSDNDSTDLDNHAGSAGTTAGSSNAGNSNGGKGGKSNGGGSNAGANNAGASNGGAGASNGGTSNGGTAGSSAAGMSPQIGGEGGDNALGGQGNAGESVGGAAGGDEAGAAGAPAIVADVLDNGTFEYEDGTGHWKDEGDASASNFKWIIGSEPGLNHWAATAYIVATVQTVSPLPHGTYSFSMDVERDPNLNDQYLFARGCKAGEPDGLQKQSTAAASSAALTTITLSNIEVSSGSCTVGIYTDAPAGGWANMDNAVFALQ